MIELLLVLVILGVLAAIVVPKFAGRSEQAKVTAAKTDIGRLEVALDAFEIDNGRFPTSQEGLRVLFERPSDGQSWRGPYIKRGIPRDPWSNEYIYEYPGRYNENGYDLYSMGPDMRQGSEDDVTNWTVEDRVQR
jgi:general secretion pathway protein G